MTLVRRRIHDGRIGTAGKIDGYEFFFAIGHNILSILPSAAAFRAPLISCNRHRSCPPQRPDRQGRRWASAPAGRRRPVFPSGPGMTSVTALAAPVDVGTIDRPPPVPPRDPYGNRPGAADPWYRHGPLSSRPRTILNSSWRTLTTGARQLVVQEALEMM